ncbi:hypothetical protein D3C81_194860 [compost metagenome]
MPSEAFDPEDIVITDFEVGRDLLLVITGGVRHIGAASIAYPDTGGVSSGTSAVPGHKEHTISERIARQAAEALGRTVTVVMGIHYDNLTKEQIFRVVETVDRKVDQFLQNKK